MIYYGKRTDSIFSQLQRGFAGSRQNYWPSQVTYVTNAVMAEHHNAVKDAIVNIEANLGLKYSSTEDSLNGILKKQEERFLPAKGQFTAYPRYTVPNAIVTFHNFSSGHIVRFLWDFGDGTTSIEKNPTHKYLAEGNYTVKLNVITSDGMQGVTNKLSYINISEENHFTFFYAVPSDPDAPNYSIESAATAYAGGDPTAIAQVFEFVDQSEGDISQRIWVFGDGTSSTITDPDKHSINHTYQSPGEYSPTLLLIKSTQKIKRVESSNTIVVI